MTISISLSPQAEATLKERAAVAGKDLATVAEDLIEQAVAIRPASASSAHWSAMFAAWMEDVKSRAANYPAGFKVDDSRESIYGDRGE